MTTNAVNRAAIALGSNVGERAAYLDAAVLALGAPGRVVAVSRYIETEPVGYPEVGSPGYVAQGMFLNAALVLETDLSPVDLMAALLRIERENGRERGNIGLGAVPKGPRTLDLDLLLYEEAGSGSAEGLARRTSLVMRTEMLTLPHPEMHLRRFVLEPLAEVAGDWVHPVLGVTVGELLRAIHP